MNLKYTFLTTMVVAGMVGTSFARADMTTHKHKKRITTTQESTDYVAPGYQDTYPDSSLGRTVGSDQNAVPTPIYHQEQQQSVAQDVNYKENRTLRDETFALTPQVGAINYTNINGAYTSKALIGLGLSLNMTPYFAPSDERAWYMGVTTGALYSHNGSASGNFFGANSSINDRDNANLLLIPADLKIGYNVTPSFRTSMHGGGNLTYRTNGNSIFLGDNTSTNNSVWRIYPNVGGDLEFQASRNVSILLRPDVTITPGNDVLSVTLGANIINL